jgi:hypothetical protein
MFRFPCMGIFASTIAARIPVNRLLLQSDDISFVCSPTIFSSNSLRESAAAP